MLLKVCDIGASHHISAEFILRPIYFLGLSISQQKIYTRINQELQLVEGIKANIFIGNNIIGSKAILLNISSSLALIVSCTIIIPIHTRQKDHLVQMKVLSANAIILPPHTKALILIHHLSLPDNRDFFFHPVAHTSLNMYGHLLDYTNTKVIVRNNFN